MLDYLVSECAWSPDRIHLFGFGQGGSVGAETALACWKKVLTRSNTSDSDIPLPRHLGSVVSVSGPLLSYPTLSAPCPTPLLFFSRATVSRDISTAFSKGFTRVKHAVKPAGQGEGGMPRSRDEWEPIMRFWSEVLVRRMGDGLYEVMSGTAT